MIEVALRKPDRSASNGMMPIGLMLPMPLRLTRPHDRRHSLYP